MAALALVARIEHLMTSPECRRALELARTVAEHPEVESAPMNEQMMEAHYAARAVRGKSAADKAAVHASNVVWGGGFKQAAELVTVLIAGSDPEAKRAEKVFQCSILRDVYGYTPDPVVFDPGWRSSDVIGIARAIYDGNDFSAMPVLADALEEAGCAAPRVLSHCRQPGVHVRGCWVIDELLGKTAEPGASPDTSRT
jgi:hypothetical protein